MKDSKFSLTNKVGLSRQTIKLRIAKTKYLLEKTRVVSRFTLQTVAQVNIHEVVQHNLEQSFKGQKQPREVFCKKSVFKKTVVPESLF